jgi:hypothetical protein
MGKKKVKPYYQRIHRTWEINPRERVVGNEEKEQELEKIIREEIEEALEEFDFD